MATFYLDIDDEITSAAARIRGADDARIVLVLPAGSRIATSRINFRLLAREAQARSRRLAIVAPEASARALATSAGLPAFVSVAEYEASLAAERAVPPVREPGEAVPAAGVAAVGGFAAAGAAAAGLPGVTAPPPVGTTSAGAPPGPRDQARRIEPEVAAGPPGLGPPGRQGPTAEALHPVGPSTGLGSGAPPRRPARGGRRTIVLAGLAALALVTVVGGVGGYVFLPTATVVVIPATRTIGPVELAVRIDPSQSEPDPEAGTVGATSVEFPVSVEGGFKATGKRVEEKKATGSVRWENCDPTAAYTIPKGTLVRTASGVGFTTAESIFLPVAIITGTSPHRGLICMRRDVDIVATRAGLGGNVDAATITRVPGAYNPKVIGVTNPAATSGGSREEFPKVTQKDVDAAVARLEGLLDEQLAAVAAAPPGLPPGAGVVSGTAERSAAAPSPDPATLVGQEAAEFSLSLAATASVLAVAPADVRSVAAVALGARVPADYRLDPSSVSITVGEPAQEDGRLSVPATGSATATRVVDPAEVRRLVAGKTPAEAETLLAPYGRAEITVWPDWIPTITSIDGRLAVEVRAGPSASPSAAPTAAPTVIAATLSPTVSPTPGPAVSATPAPTTAPGATP